ncbi:hypothetical protein EPUS_00869 [Endocarpon pusillum Z07020]|uniref:Protein alcS n=1 Tax=Endocarpon pusillum (strain Z07020 / HMAS-L-300199) TaxID=1263415 RepID=U1GNX0_ENDPU|nr:uncharacterized protein EPUS_00869 [Endocarpon pusillum Z07020]ERF73616.1 hypothetical protein EPUS_00869 [Endocarpon pusillum Z07020]
MAEIVTEPSSGTNGKSTYQMDEHADSEAALRRVETAGNLSISPELFEKLYLSPKNEVSNNLRTTFGNPSPLAVVGFILSLTPLSCALLGWRGSGGLGAAENGAYYFFGGLLMFTGGLLEFVLGNTFPFVVFCSYGAYWFTFGATLTPYYNAYGAYSPDDPAAGLTDPVFLSTFAFFLLWMGVLSFIYLIASLRTNILFFLIFLTLCPMYCCLAAGDWQAAQGNAEAALTLQHAGGAMAFMSCLIGWYDFLVLVLLAVDFPLNLPVGDLSHIIKGAGQTGGRRLRVKISRV